MTDEPTPSPADTARATIETEIAGLRALGESIDGSFSQAVDLLHDCRGRVIVSGIGKSGHIGQKIAATLASTGTPAFFMHAAEAAHGDLGMIGRDDVVIALSNSGESVELRAIVEYCRRFGVILLAVTARPESTLGRLATLVLRLPEAAEACPLALSPMTSTTMMLVLGDALAAALIRKRDFRSDDFAQFHPAGKLGAQLVKLAELVDRNPFFAAVPSVPEDCEMAGVIVSITDGRRGVTGVRAADGRLVGVITDGDLRRALADRTFFDKRARDIMTRNPRTIRGDRIAVEALAMCERHKISALFVTDDAGAISGLVHLQDLLALGIA
ncbi:MAG: SIS domain-containing protein [Rhizobiaceae bacterium]